MTRFGAQSYSASVLSGNIGNKSLVMVLQLTTQCLAFNSGVCQRGRGGNDYEMC